MKRTVAIFAVALTALTACTSAKTATHNSASASGTLTFALPGDISSTDSAFSGVDRR